MIRGIISLKIPSFLGSDYLILDAIKFSKEKGYVCVGESVICVVGQNEESYDYVNSMKVACVN